MPQSDIKATRSVSRGKLELDEAGDIISYGEYHPYGTTSYQAINTSINAVAKR